MSHAAVRFGRSPFSVSSIALFIACAFYLLLCSFPLKRFMPYRSKTSIAQCWKSVEWVKLKRDIVFSYHFYISQKYLFGRQMASKKITEQKQGEANKDINIAITSRPRSKILTPLLLC